MSFLEAIWNISLELAPWLFLGAVVSAFLHRFLPTDLIQKKLHGYRGIFTSVMLGVPLPLCSCGVIPAGIGLKKDGASDSSSVAFLISTPQTGVDSIFVSAAFLGWPFAIVKVGAAIVTGVFGGILTEAISPPLEENSNLRVQKNQKPSWKDAWEHGVQLLRSIWRWLVFGIVISALLTVFIPAETLTAAPDSGWSLLLALIISLPLYVCATASVPIAAALVAGGLPINAALVFLMAGPASNVATIGSIYKTFGSRITAIYLSTIIIGSVFFAWMLESVLSDQTVAITHVHEHLSWQVPFAVLLAISFIYFAYEEIQKKIKKPLKETNNQYWIQGISCSSCVSKIEKKMLLHPQITEVSVEVSGQTQFKGYITHQEMTTIVEELGFELLYTNLSIEIKGMDSNGCVAKLEEKLRTLDGVEDVSVQTNPDIALLKGKVSLPIILEAVHSVGLTMQRLK